MYKISDKIISFITKAMENWRAELRVRGQIPAVLKIQRGIFEENALTTAINYSNDVTQPQTYEMNEEAINFPNHRKWLITLCTWMR